MIKVNNIKNISNHFGTRQKEVKFIELFCSFSSIKKLQVFKNPSQNLIGTDVCHCQTTHCGAYSIGSANQDVITQTVISGLQYGEGRRRVEGGFDHKINNDYITVSKCHCITASGSGFHQLLAASKKRRKSPNPPKVLEPPAYQVIDRCLSPLPIK